MEKVKQEAIAKVLNSKEDDMFVCKPQTTIVGGEMVQVNTIKQNMSGMSEFTKKIVAGEMYADFAAKKRSLLFGKETSSFRSEALVQEHMGDTGLDSGM